MTGTTFYFKLKVVSPMHIGCDEVYEPTGFVVDEQKKELISFEPAEFLDKLEQQDLDKFSAICRKGTLQSLLEVYKFIRLHKQHASGRRVAVSDAFVSHYNKTLHLQPARVQQELNKFLVSRTAYEKKNSQPYIPGSAIKGALRTAILNLRNTQQSGRRYRNGKELNETLSGGTFSTDPFRFVKVGDFHAAGEAGQSIVYGVNKKKKPSKKEAGGPYQLLEVVEEGAEFIGSITVQHPEKGAQISAPVTFAEINRALNSFYVPEQNKEKATLQSIGCDFFDAKGDLASSLVRIGRHSGAECVTVEGHRKIWIKKKGSDGEVKPHTTTVWLAADAAKPSNNRRLRPFGWAELLILSEEEADGYRQERIDRYQKWEADHKEAMIKFQEQAAALAEQQELERLEQQRRAREQEEKEQELRNFPWRIHLPRLDRVSDWGALKTQVLEDADFTQYQGEREVAEAVSAVAAKVAKGNVKKWEQERDVLVASWLQPSGLEWMPLAANKPNKENPLLGKISTYKTPADYDRGLDIASLDLACCRALLSICKQWGWDKKKKAKAGNHKLWKQLQGRIKQLK